MPEATLIQFDSINFIDDLRSFKTARFTNHICFGSKWEPGIEIGDDEGIVEANNLKNPEALAKILVLDLWLQNDDRLPNNLNLHNSAGYVLPFDHAAILGQVPFEMLCNNEIINDWIGYHDVFACLTGSNIFRINFNNYSNIMEKSGIRLCEEIRSITGANLIEIFNDVPNEWELSQNSLNCIIKYLMNRVNNLEKTFRLHLDFGVTQ